MNKDRRKRIDQIIEKLQQAESEIEEILGEEQDYFDNMPESFQMGEKGDQAQNAVSELESAQSSVQDAVSSLESAQE